MRRVALGLLLALLAGCASSADSTSAGPIHNGQTGSLVPVCGLGAQQLTLHESNRGFVIDTRGCRSGTGPAGVSLVGEDGEPVEFSAVSLGNGKYLIVPSVTLAPGDYAVSLEGSSRGLTVEPPTALPAPTRVGELQQLAPVNCSLSLALTLDPAALALAPLLRLTLSIDGFSTLYRDFGELTAEDPVIEILCAGSCVGPGRHVVEVTAELAGEPLALEPAATTIDVECSNVEDNAGCSFSSGPGSRPWALVVLVVLGLSARRRSSARGESRGMQRGSSG